LRAETVHCSPLAQREALPQKGNSLGPIPVLRVWLRSGGGSIPRTVSFRLLSNAAKFPAAVLALAQKYATGGNLQVRSSADIHDRVIFADNRVWVCGQSLKDAAKTKPTYIVEHDEPLMRRIYEDVWANATRVV
jgi:hypothetical protein